MQALYDYRNRGGADVERMFIEVHPRSKPAELVLLNISDIKYVYPNPEEEAGAVIRLHADGRNTIDVNETYEQLKALISKATGLGNS